MAPASSSDAFARTTLSRPARTTRERAATKTRILLRSPGPFANMNLHFPQHATASYAKAHRRANRGTVQHFCQYLRIGDCTAIGFKQDIADGEPGRCGRPFRLDAEQQNAGLLIQVKLLLKIGRKGNRLQRNSQKAAGDVALVM